MTQRDELELILLRYRDKWYQIDEYKIGEQEVRGQRNEDGAINAILELISERMKSPLI